jgi:hypothetical protein
LESAGDDHRRERASEEEDDFSESEDTFPRRPSTIKNFPVQEYPSDDTDFKKEDVRTQSTLKGKSEEILKLPAATVMKMKTKKSSKETGTSKQSEPLIVLSPKTRRQVKAAEETASVMESASAMDKHRPGRASKKSRSVDL